MNKIHLFIFFLFYSSTYSSTFSTLVTPEIKKGITLYVGLRSMNDSYQVTGYSSNYLQSKQDSTEYFGDSIVNIEPSGFSVMPILTPSLGFGNNRHELTLIGWPPIGGSAFFVSRYKVKLSKSIHPMSIFVEFRTFASWSSGDSNNEQYNTYSAGVSKGFHINNKRSFHSMIYTSPSIRLNTYRISKEYPGIYGKTLNYEVKLPVGMMLSRDARLPFTINWGVFTTIPIKEQALKKSDQTISYNPGYFGLEAGILLHFLSKR